MSEVPTKHNLQVLHFTIENAHACIKLEYINQVLPLTLLEPVPDAPSFLAGLMNLSGLSVPIIDLTILLHIPKENTAYTLNTPILLCSDGSHQVGLIIDQILGLALVDKESQMKEEFDQKDSLVEAVIIIESELTLLLNMQHLFEINLVHKPAQSMEY